MRRLSKNEWVGVTVAVSIVLVAIVFPSFNIDILERFLDPTAMEPTNEFTTPEGLTISDAVLGEGAEAVNGAMVYVYYSGMLEDGTVFDSRTDGEPFSFVLGEGFVIRGWDLGVLGMKVGGKRTLTIPPELGYGDAGIGPIPGGATLIFEVELIDVGN